MSVTKPGLASPQTYIITDAALEYTHPDFVADPTYCPLDYTYDVTEFKNKNDVDTNAITRTDKSFSIEYSDDLSPVTPT